MTALPSFLTGVYWFKPVQHCDDDKPPGTYALLRFFADGTVVSAGVKSEDLAADWPLISRWFNETHHDRGTYRLSGEMVAFTIETPKSVPAGSVEYFGVVKGTRITLNWRSRINGAIQNGVEYQLM
jgi:hypothetical protein